MATSKDYLEYILDGLSELDEITFRQMMGEYIIYYRGKIAAYVCDNRFLVKPVKSALDMLDEIIYEPPYDGAKDMLLVEQTDDKSFLAKLFNAMYEELPMLKKKTEKKKK